MKRREFSVGGLPQGYEVRKVDLTPSGIPVCVATHRTDYQADVLLLSAGSTLAVPEELIWRNPLTSFVFPPLVRCMGEERVLLVGGRGEANACILNYAGHVDRSFNVGSASEVLANEDWIIAHYSDQAMTSDYHPVDREGLAVFDAAGNYVWGFESHFAGNPRLDVFFHAAAWISPDEVGVYRDIDQLMHTRESFIRLNVRDRILQTSLVPANAFLATALTVSGKHVFFHSPLGRIPIFGIPPSIPGMIKRLKVKTGRMNPPPGEGDILQWDIGSAHCAVVGHYPGRGSLRGLTGGRFIAVKPDGYSILSLD